MSVQYDNNNFSDTMPLDEAIEHMQERVDLGLPVKALWVGTEESIEKVKQEAELSERLTELEKQFQMFTINNTGRIAIPTTTEIELFGVIESDVQQ